MPRYTGGPDYSRIEVKGAAGLLVVAMAFSIFVRMFAPLQTAIIVAVVVGGALCLFPIMSWLRARNGDKSRPLSLVPPNPSLQRTRQKRRAAELEYR